ncbi:hypothetical protein HID58_069440, partial [Brassica napus]
HPRFLEVVASSWSSLAPLYQSRTALKLFHSKLKNLKSVLGQLNREMFGDLPSRVKQAYEDLCVKQTEAMNSPSKETFEEASAAWEHWHHIYGIEEQFYFQTSRIQWLGLGDRKNVFYHNICQARNSKNPIKRIITVDGRVLTYVTEIKTEASLHFETFLNGQPTNLEEITVEQLRDVSSLDLRVVTRLTIITRSMSRHSTDESSLDRRVVTRPFCRHSTDLSSLGAERSLTVARLDLRSPLARSLASLGSISRGHSLALLTRPTSHHSTDESSLDRRVITRPTSHHSTDESSLDRRVVTRPTSPHSTDESSLDRQVVTRPTSPHSTDESSLDRFVVTQPFCRHSTVLSLLGAERSLAVARLDLRSCLARSLAIVLVQSLGSISRGHSLALLTRRSIISRSPSDLSLLAELTCRSVVTRSTSRHSTDESSLDRRILTRPTSCHSTVLSSLDRFVVTRPTSRHSTDELSLDRRVVTRPTSCHSTDESSLDRRVVTRPTSRNSTDESSLDPFVVTRPFCRHSIDESSLNRRVLTRPTSPHSTDESSHDRFVVTRPFCRHSAQSVLSSLGAERSLASICAVAWLDLSRSLDSLPCGHSTCSSWSLDLLSRIVTRPTSPHSTDESSLDRFVVTRPFCRHTAQSVLSPQSAQSLGLISRGHSTRSLAVTRLAPLRSLDLFFASSLDRRVVTRPFCRHSTILSSLGAERSLASICAVAWLDLSRSLDSISRGHSTRSLAVTRLVLRVVTRPTSPHSTDESSLDRFVVTRPFCRHSAQSVLSPQSAQSLGSISRGHSTRSLAVTRLDPLRSLDLFFASTVFASGLDKQRLEAAALSAGFSTSAPIKSARVCEVWDGITWNFRRCRDRQLCNMIQQIEQHHLDFDLSTPDIVLWKNNSSDYRE